MIIVLNGPLGCGKTSTAWALMEALQPAVMLDGDYLVAYEPFDYNRPEDLQAAYEIFALLIHHHRRLGKEYFILNWVFETPEQLQQLLATLRVTELDSLVVRLDASPEVLRQRIQQRNNQGQLSWELERGPELKSILDASAQRGFMGHYLDTTHLERAEVVEEILGLLAN